MMAMNSEDWVLDTGAPFHITFERQLLPRVLLETANEHMRQARIRLTLPVLGLGSVSTDRLKIPDVFYVPAAPMNTVSVHKLAEQGFITAFEQRCCYVEVEGGVKLQDVLHVPGLTANLVSVSKLTDQLTEQLAVRLRNHGLARQGQIMGVPQLQTEINWLAHELQQGGMPQHWSHEIARQLRAMGGLRLLIIDELDRQLEASGVQHLALPGSGQHQFMGGPQQLRVIKLASQLQCMGVKLLDMGEQRDWMADLACKSSKSTNPPNDCWIGPHERLPVPQLLLDKNSLHPQGMCAPQLPINELAHRLQAVGMGPLGEGVFPVKIGQVDVGYGARVDGFFCFLKLRPCPPVRLSAHLDEWRITEAQ